VSCNAKFDKAGQEGTLSRPDRLNIIHAVFQTDAGPRCCTHGESFEIATKIAYLNGRLSGAPRDGNKDCSMVTTAPMLPAGYVVSASRIADRRMILAGYRLADRLTRVVRTYRVATGISSSGT